MPSIGAGEGSALSSRMGRHVDVNKRVNRPALKAPGWRSWVIFGAIWLLATALVSVPESHGSECVNTASRTARVARVIDAQTLRLDEGLEVRLIGALAPETPGWWKPPKPWPPAKAARRALERLVASEEVELRFAPDEPERDRHDRLLAQVYVLDGQKPVWVQGHMVGVGYALTYSFAEHRACARKLQQLEYAARAARRGLWKHGRFTVLNAAEPSEISKRRGRYQLVEGRIVSVGHTSRWTFLNFAEDWKKDFTVAIRAGNRRGFEGSGVELSQLEGRRVRVRGWLERWNGPIIKATHPEQIEVLAD